ncbi:protein arginine methyltransferase NDUFAF7, mitochondrial isoform X1 [Hydra vulgaris]|uniref:protein arginine methyltransferase NDUFAF7, mitochondrial isoform X1 n=2 Tax=Hydra vulgaris TaxID=6087 RepID=UPI001F5FCE7E|nr:protein arginine methyltransferase NDUFAF7, mitochondrial isoform X1 [Hydra vulgaris]
MNLLRGRNLNFLADKFLPQIRLQCKSVHTCLFDHLKSQIKIVGPMTVANYMKEALTNPKWVWHLYFASFGYYMKNDVFGAKGDFTTSPEISQMFGELIGIWFVAQWIQIGKPCGVQLVELGPGRGTLMADILRVMKQFPETLSNFEVNFVEVSEKMISLQKQNLGISHEKKDFYITPSGTKVSWFTHVQDVPKGLTFYLAHEFFDALPVHLFKKVNGKYHELLVGLNRSENELQLVTAPGPSPVAKTFLNSETNADECEVCPEAAVVMSYISENISMYGGCAMIIDYGESDSQRFSLRGYKNHVLVDNIFKNPGSCDITANVDFGFLKRCIRGEVRHYGPITQRSFLLQMGIQQRLKVLLSTATSEQARNLISSLDYLISPEKMGEKFKCFALTNLSSPVPPCFT